MTDWLSLAEAIEAIETRLGVPTGPAQVELIKACASSEVRSIEHNPEHGKEGVDWWPFHIPASEWQAADARIDLSTGEALAYGSRVLTKECGRDADGRIVLQAWMAKVLISNADLQYWLRQRDAPAVKRDGKKGCPPRQREKARAALGKLRKDGIDVGKETTRCLVQFAKERGYGIVSERTMRRARGGK